MRTANAKRYTSRGGTAILRVLVISLSIVSCSASALVRSVTRETYQSDRTCWFNAANHFSAFLILAPSDGKYVPYAVSRWCSVKDNLPAAVSTLNNLGAIRIAGDNGLLMRGGYLPLRLEQNTNPHNNVPPEDAHVYAFEGSVSVGVEGDVKILHILRVHEFRRLSVNFGKFALMSPQDRYKLL